MTVEKINATTWANIYGVYDASGAVIGSVEVVLGGPNCGAYAYTLTGKYSRRQIMQFYKAAAAGGRI